MGSSNEWHSEVSRFVLQFVERFDETQTAITPVDMLLASQESFIGDILYKSISIGPNSASLSNIRRSFLVGELSTSEGVFWLRDNSGRIRIRFCRLHRFCREVVLVVQKYRLICPEGEENYLEVNAEDARVYITPASATSFSLFTLADPLSLDERSEVFRLWNPFSVSSYLAMKRHKTSTLHMSYLSCWS